MGGRFASLGWSVLVLALVLLGPGARAYAETTPPSASEARGKADKVLDKDYQKELPEDRRHELEVPAGGAPIASMILWVLIAVAVVLLVVFVVRELGGYEQDESVPTLEGGESAEATAAVVERPLDDAEALARSGRFGEAIHVLLLRTLEELMRKLDRPLPRSKTSREILVEVRLPDEARGALSHLVSAVEVSFFGGAEPGADDYRMCVDRFRRFADAYTRGVRA